ncbi:RsmB/NOP family class I SAM-dependent RNA methyltransferase [Pseudooceanicola algae]|uniref:Ribosomal RNA small subunit methyltransferase B n=1 Tax=Pseudooceanicola algae TaxID=1537215 RepID=A0A418SG38_9RHOB|nr:transcription antitermination factor NusB [Pseudooceanicola algae]QPM91643.1 Ribosomal RNA small subunit methyltransferase B [Pseudooceanicola algae]
MQNPRKPRSRRPAPQTQGPKPAAPADPQDRAPRIPTARDAALRMLNEVLGEDPRLLSDLRDAPWLRPMPPADRARALRLATETLRGLERCDRLLFNHLKKTPPPEILNILRLGCYELATGAAAHGVVNDLVQAAGRVPKQAHMKGLVNAVLRKTAEEAPVQWTRLRAPRLPDWLREPLCEAYGKPRVSAFELAQSQGAPLDLTPRDPSAAADWSEKLGGVLLPIGSIRLEAGQQVSALPGYDDGGWWIQDAAAALPARILAPQAGENILDLCAAPGGKTLQLAAAGARVTALDLSENRLKRLQENLQRTGLTASVLGGDALEFQPEDGTLYDAILLDAPCSATGTIRRHPDLPLVREGDEIGGLIELQAAMLDHALTLLKPGGRLIFCTCSLIPDEGECQVEEALARHPGLSVDRDALTLPGVEPDWITEEGGLRLTPDMWPDLGGMDGFYMACLRKGA